MKRILAVMIINPDFVQFAIPELKSVLSQLPIPLEVLFKQDLTIQPKHSYQITHQTLRNFPFVTLNVPDYQKHQSFFQKACKQTIMLNKLILLIAQGKTYDDLLIDKDEQLLKEKCRNWEDTVACDFFSRNRIVGRNHELLRMNKLMDDLDVRGKINIKNAKIRYQLIQNHAWYQFHHQTSVQSTLKNVFFGIQLCTNKIGTAKFNNAYELSKRIYLGPTSADNDLAFMMCNQAKVQAGSFVLDPFVGTGGLIIPPASKGAYVFGCDLDMRVLNGYSVGRINKKSSYYNPESKFQTFTPKIILNFQQYGLTTPNILRMDSTNLAFKTQQMFDAIITDPPYGLRAMSRSIGGPKKQNQKLQQKQIAEDEQIHKNTGQEDDQQTTVEVVSDNAKQNSGEVKSQQKSSSIKNSTYEYKKQEQQQDSKKRQQKQAQNQQNLLNQEQLLQLKKKKQQKRKLQKENRQIKQSLLSEDEKQFKKSITHRLNRQRIENWEKFDRTKVECTDRLIIFQRLINFARTNLKEGGRLVFLYPIYEDQEYKRVQSLPDHQGFTVVDMSENKLSKNNSRILVTLEKQFKQKIL